MNLNILESLWIALNLAALILTLSALVDALADRTAIRLLNGHAREAAAAGIVRRESFRVVVQALLLLAVLPGALVPGEAVINLTVFALMAVPVVLLTSSILDARERKLTTIMVAADILAESTKGMARVEAAIAENTSLTIVSQRGIDTQRVTVDHTAEQVEEIHDSVVKP